MGYTCGTLLRTRGLLATLFFAFLGCSSGGTATDGGATVDAANADAASPDAANADAASADAGNADAANVDSGQPDAASTPRLEILEAERPVAVSGDGKTVLVWQQSSGELSTYDVATSTLTPKTTLAPEGLEKQQPMALSNTRRIAAGYGSRPTEPALWDETHGWVQLGSPLPGCVDTSTTPPVPQDLGVAFDLSDDGHIAVGALWLDCNEVQAFRWSDATSTGTFALLERVGVGLDLVHPGNNRATVVSSDGAIAAGWAFNAVADRSPAIWNADGRGRLLDPADTMNPGEVLAIDRLGTTVAGLWARPTGGLDGFVWSEARGVERFGPPDMADQSSMFVTSMTGDGAHVFGRWRFQATFFDPEDDNAFVWSRAKGLRKIADLATAHGLTVPAGLRLASVQSASADGLVLVGEARLPPDPNDPLMLPVLKVFVLVLPPGALD